MQLTQNWQELEATLSKIIAKTWIDEQFRQQFISKPADILREAGVVIDDFVKVIVKQNANNVPVLQAGNGGTVYEINLPSKPENLEEEELSVLMQEMVNKAPSLRFSSC
jgi:hypothetical protein